MQLPTAPVSPYMSTYLRRVPKSPGARGHLGFFQKLFPLQLFATLRAVACLCSWDPPGKNTGVGSHSLLQGIFPTRELNLSPALAGGFFTTELPGKPYLSTLPHSVYPHAKTTSTNPSRSAPETQL